MTQSFWRMPRHLNDLVQRGVHWFWFKCYDVNWVKGDLWKSLFWEHAYRCSNRNLGIVMYSLNLLSFQKFGLTIRKIGCATIIQALIDLICDTIWFDKIILICIINYLIHFSLLEKIKNFYKTFSWFVHYVFEDDVTCCSLKGSNFELYVKLL